MILKTKDDVGPLVSQLNELLKRTLTERQRRSIEQEKATILAGARAEAEAAYLIDFHLRDVDNWAVIHDLRLEHNDRVAQIDHLLIWRGLEVYVVESKGFRSKVRITGDRWEVLRNNHWTGVPSPVAQNERHILVLKELLRASDWAPKFFGKIRQPIRYINVVAVPPECGIRGDNSGVMVVSMDNLVKTVRSDRAAFLSPTALSAISVDGLCDLGLHLVDCHRPATFDFAARFGVSQAPPTGVPAARNSAQTCINCGSAMTKAEVFFCRVNPERFAGRMLCRRCQGAAPATEPEAEGAVRATAVDSTTPKVAARPEPAGARCVECGVTVEEKVVAFCRLKRRRFDGKTVCRRCQGRYPG
jgi:hypothetical protein